MSKKEKNICLIYNPKFHFFAKKNKEFKWEFHLLETFGIIYFETPLFGLIIVYLVFLSRKYCREPNQVNMVNVDYNFKICYTN